MDNGAVRSPLPDFLLVRVNTGLTIGPKCRNLPAVLIAAAAGVPGFENLRGLEQVPARGAWVVALPALIRNGSGGPLRAIAIVPASR